ncbi:MAG: very short patch repair endonuclease [Armatimonadota bacterium]|nr:very short patch repair endonuclease [Armatimonadota bacterium]
MLYRRTQEQVSDIMRRVKSEDTTPEVTFRKALWAGGVRYRLHPARLPGKPDIVLRRSRLVIFIDGDFWHGNQWRSRGHASLEAQFVASPNASYWVPKIDRNMRRDRLNTAALLEQGWRVLRFWESAVKSDIDACLRFTLEAAAGRVETTAISRLPQQTAAVFGDDPETMRAGLELAGWTLKPPAEITDSSLAAATLMLGDNQIAGLVSLLNTLKPADKPPLVLIRLRDDSQSNLADILRDLNSMGYLCDAFVLDAEEFHAVDTQRLYVVGIVDAPESKAVPVESATRPRSLVDFIARQRDIRWFHWDLPPFEPRHYQCPEIDDTYTVHAAAIRWIGEKYLNPLINVLMHGRCLI